MIDPSALADEEFCIVLFDHNNAMTFLERRALDEAIALFPLRLQPELAV
jgi:hypothetical protein